ncbi:MAG: tetratricopeptide repeat protein [Nitrospirae bacterium]|nr:tetratricopeptide repeat protein [Nitrospirota bacterium]
MSVRDRTLGKAREAIDFFEQALVIRRAVGDLRGEGTDLWNMSVALYELGERKKAITHGEAALKIFEEIEHPSVAMVRQTLAKWRDEGGE